MLRRATFARTCVILCAAALSLVGSINGTIRLTAPRAEAGAGAIAVSVAAGGNHTCAITSAGGVKCWGDNAFGQLGDGTTVNRTAPVDVQGLTSGVSSLAAGIEQTCALLTDGHVKCWGGNSSGQLGDGTTTGHATPAYVCGVNQPATCALTLSGVTGISAAGRHVCAIGAGGATCWGDNTYGQLGDGTTTNRPSPVDIPSLSAGVVSISAGAFGSEGFSCASLVSTSVKCWGMNSVGQLGDGTTLPRSFPLAVCASGSGGLCPPLTGASAVTAGSGHACARMADELKCWGYNAFGQLGDGTTIDRLLPASVCAPAGCPATLATVTGATAGEHHTCAVYGGTNLLVCWGENFFGQIGDGTTIDRTVPTAPIVRAPWVTGHFAATGSFAAGHGHTCATTGSFALRCWGYGGFGQLGDLSNATRLAPHDVYTLGDFDGDALWDAWELTGDTNDDGVQDIDLPAMGANPLVKDLFVESDWMDCAVAGRLVAPRPRTPTCSIPARSMPSSSRTGARPNASSFT